jgi:hypothetical protein
LPSLERGGEPVEPRFPETSIRGDPGIELAEGFRAQGIKAPGSFRTDLYEARVLENTQVPRDAGLVDMSGLDDVVDGLFATPQKGFHDQESGRVGQGLEGA